MKLHIYPFINRHRRQRDIRVVRYGSVLPFIRLPPSTVENLIQDGVNLIPQHFTDNIFDNSAFWKNKNIEGIMEFFKTHLCYCEDKCGIVEAQINKICSNSNCRNTQWFCQQLTTQLEQTHRVCFDW